jgi:hypothetical protein
MIASADEARLVLAGWRENTAPLLVWLATDDAFGVTFRTIISDLSDIEVQLGAQSPSARVFIDGATFEFLHPYEIESLKHISIRFVGPALSIRRRAGAWCCLIAIPNS